jgi:hypothetical protein
MVQVTPTAGAVSNGADSGPPAAVPAHVSPLAVVIGTAGLPAASIAMRIDGSGERFRLIVLDAGDAALLVLGPYDEEDVVAEWRRLAAASGLALKIQLPNGAVASPFPQIGRVLLGATRQRRRHGLLSHRRPRFLTRRKTGRFPARPQVHREAEIARGEIG